MRLGRPLLVILALLFIVAGVPSVPAMDSKDPGWLNDNEVGDDGGATDGDPWQDNGGGGATTTHENGGGGFTIHFRMNFSWPFIDFFVISSQKTNLTPLRVEDPKPGIIVKAKRIK